MCRETNSIRERVSVLIPAYNCQNQLDNTVRALPPDLPLHVLIVDDGSDPPLVQPPCDPVNSMHILRNEKNLGIHGALRRGVEALVAQGFEYAARLDAGDFALPRRFSLQKQFLDNHPEIDLVGSAFEYTDVDERMLYVVKLPLTDVEIRRQILLRCGLAHPAVMFRLSAVMRAGNYRDTHPCAEDRDLFLRIIMNGKAANLPNVLTRVVQSPESITVRRRHMMIISLIRLQFAYFRPAYIEDWTGLLKSFLQLTVPHTVLEKGMTWCRRSRE